MTPETRRLAQAEVRAYDFRRPTTLAREHSRVLELAYGTFARQWGTQLTAKVRVLSQVTCEQVTMHTYDEYAAALPSSTAMVLCSIADVEPRGVIQLPTGAALGWVNLMLGGSKPTALPDRTFSPIEHALIQGLMNDALVDLQYSLGPLLTPSIRVDAIQYNAQFAQAAPTAELMIVARFSVRVGEEATDASVALPARVLLEQLGETNPTVPVENVKQLLHAQVAQVPVEVTARLATAPVTPGTVLGMRVGDVVTLPHPAGRPIHVFAGGQLVASAAVGASGSRLAVVVTTSEENS